MALSASQAVNAEMPTVPKEVVNGDDACAATGPEACGMELLQQNLKKRAAFAGQSTSENHKDLGMSAASSTSKGLAPSSIDAVYTFGAPATSSTPFTNAASTDGCFQGLRSYNENLLGFWQEIHQVDAPAMFNNFKHASVDTAVLHWGIDSYHVACNSSVKGQPEWPTRGGQVYHEWTVHTEQSYIDRLSYVKVDGFDASGFEPYKSAKFFASIAFKAYDTLDNTKKAVADKMPGWTVVEREISKHGTDQKAVVLVQDSVTLDCAVVFAGMNTVENQLTGPAQKEGEYCGLEGVHAGYSSALRTITQDVWKKVRLRIQACQKVICVGQDFGGAMCEIMAACANSGNFFNPDYQLLTWIGGWPSKLPEVQG